MVFVEAADIKPSFVLADVPIFLLSFLSIIILSELCRSGSRLVLFYGVTTPQKKTGDNS